MNNQLLNNEVNKVTPPLRLSQWLWLGGVLVVMVMAMTLLDWVETRDTTVALSPPILRTFVALRKLAQIILTLSGIGLIIWTVAWLFWRLQPPLVVPEPEGWSLPVPSALRPAKVTSEAGEAPAFRISADPQAALAQGQTLAIQGRRDEAITCFMAVFHDGQPELRSQAKVELEKLKAVEWLLWKEINNERQ